ncbi:sigma-70 family RNA polymerase sigma factor [Streptomyces sp. SID5785]|uniref:RNA polymerase sigma factor SigJ n=1 Tax=Streptomyces sp. SID5785 TaxID=2690309 RepID=UPI001360F78F|nr:RNA polymerase sigma factor SigJ [Streptomyces sp. SID5785]MZD07677.1 sigma-70 family RNA polymerase sigma factor [Streptomyces sp. SID5785]
MPGKEAGQEHPGTDAVPDDRHLLMSIAFRMLGSTHDAEDVVQDTYARWYALPESARAEIERPSAWLVRVVGRVCLDHLGSARVRRERYTGQWLPEPLPESTAWSSVRPAALDPAEQAALDDSLTMGMLVLLDSLTPAQRVAFVLHDVFTFPFAEIASIVGRSPESCRALAVAARRGLGSARRDEADVPGHLAVIKEFKKACETGELDELIGLLDPRVTTRADGGGHVRAALHPLHGAEKTARYLVGSLRKRSELTVELGTAARRPALVCRAEGRVVAVVSLHVVGRRITDVWVVMNPEKLTNW